MSEAPQTSNFCVTPIAPEIVSSGSDWIEVQFPASDAEPGVREDSEIIRFVDGVEGDVIAAGVSDYPFDGETYRDENLETGRSYKYLARAKCSSVVVDSGFSASVIL